jgi:hypothetical protein
MEWLLMASAGFVFLAISVTNEIVFRRLSAQVPGFAAHEPLLRRLNVGVRVFALLALALAVVFRVLDL